MTWLTWLLLALIIAAVAAVTGIKAKGARHVAAPGSWASPALVLLITVGIAYAAYPARSGS